MIIKSFEISKKKIDNFKFFLFYGENQGYKEESIKLIVKKDEVVSYYYENEIFNNLDQFTETLITKSFFENKKLIVVKKATDKILTLIETLFKKELEDVKIILIADELTKKSKLRNYFEKDKNLLCSAFYADNYQSLIFIVNDFLRNNKIEISREIINLIIERSQGSRLHLKNELEKIRNYSLNKKTINLNDVKTLSNLNDNYQVSELVDNCLAKNKIKLTKILNENNLSNDEVIKIIRVFLSKAKRLYQIKKNTNDVNIDSAINNFKPPIFWKDKDLVKKQINNWTLKSIKLLLIETNKTEYLIKKNFSNSLKILLDFIYKQTNSISN